MRVAFLYNEFSEDPTFGVEAEQPVDFAPADALRRLGYDVTPVAATFDLAGLRRRLEQVQPDVVFNRVESLRGSDRTAAAVPMLLDAMELPYTGCSTEALLAAADKPAVKERLRAAGLPTPNWITLPSPFGRGAGGEGALQPSHAPSQDNRRPKPRHPHPSPLPKGEGTEQNRPLPEGEGTRYILKAVFEHASFQMDDDAVFSAASDKVVRQRIAQCEARWGRPFFAEQFIDGREFNLSLLAGQVLPPAEIDFSAFRDDQLPIVGYRAKFDAGAFEYHHTPRRFDFPAEDAPLLAELAELATVCWRLFGLTGFARVDFRCDRQGRPSILEINANPCLERESGFAAALEQAGIGYDGGIERLVDDAMARAEGGRGRAEGRHGWRCSCPQPADASQSTRLAPNSFLPPSAFRLPP